MLVFRVLLSFMFMLNLVITLEYNISNLIINIIILYYYYTFAERM